MSLVVWVVVAIAALLISLGVVLVMRKKQTGDRLGQRQPRATHANDAHECIRRVSEPNLYGTVVTVKL